MLDDSNLTRQLIMAAWLIAGTFLVHGIFVAVISAILRAISDHMKGLADIVRDVLVLMGIAVGLLIAHFSSIWMWALNYIRIGVFDNIEEALYFSAATYTTLGYGDILPPPEWRLLAGALATNGLLLFGLSAAILVDATVRLRLGGE